MSDYLIFEKNYIKKKWKKRVPIALVFPNFYKVGMSNLGFLYIYQRLNQFEEIVCERFFLPEKETTLRSIESKAPLKNFRIILFSIPFEVDYINVVKILKLGNISLESKERKEIVLAGGVATWLNPEPLASFIDGFLLGDWEELEDKIVPLFIEHSQNKKEFLKRLNEYPFSYLPLYNEKKIIKVFKNIRPKEFIYSTIVSQKTEFSNTYLIEVSKGCGRGCRFCAAGFLYRPPRTPPSEYLENIINEIPNFSKVGLIGLEFADKEEIFKLAKKLIEKNCVLTFSSLRIDSLNDDFLTLLKGTKSIAIAPETASLKLKKVINKNISEDEIFLALEKFQKKGLKNIKMYFMIGLPLETEEDREETINFIKKIIKQKYKLHFSFKFSFFVPKPHTPFQWYQFPSLEELKKLEKSLKKRLLEIKNVKIESPKLSFIQAIIARGDKNLKSFLISLANGESLNRAIKNITNLSQILSPQNSLNTTFPWDKIDIWVKKEYLWKEWKRALSLKNTPFCDPKNCKSCGACSILEKGKF